MCILALLGLFTIALRPFVAPPAENRLQASDDLFLKRASRQLVDWRLLNGDSLSEARRLERPIFLVVGLSVSSFGRQMDDMCFGDTEIARYLNANFVSIRVDGLDQPEMLNALFPLARVSLGITPEFQMWVLDPSANIVEPVPRPPSNEEVSRDVFLGQLIEALSTYQSLEGSDDPPKGAVVQDHDLDVIANPESLEEPDVAAFEQNLRLMVDERSGGLGDSEFQMLQPNALQFLLKAGATRPAVQLLQARIASPMFDIQDGGFFRASLSRDFSAVQFDKAAVENAEMLTALGHAQLATHDPLLDYAAKQTFELLDTRMRVKGQIAAFQTETGKNGNRSDRYSFSLRRLRDTLDPGERTWARDWLGLYIPANPQMVPHLTRTDAIGDSHFNPILKKLRAANSTTPRNLSGFGFLETEAWVTARMVEWARMTGDAGRLHRALMRAKNLDPFVSEDGLRRQVGSDGAADGDLGDYLSFADAKLQIFLATADSRALDEGLQQLILAESMFRGDVSGEYRLTLDPPLLPDADVPEIVDNFGESDSARMMRLLNSYGLVERNRVQGEALRSKARSILRRFGTVADPGSIEFAGFYADALDLEPGPYALAIGPRAVALARSLAAQAPRSLVLLGTERSDLQRSAPGIYVDDGQWRGPLSVMEARAMLAETSPPRAP